MNPTEILETISKEEREPTSYERGQLRAALPSADSTTVAAINAALESERASNRSYAAGRQRAVEMYEDYPILAASMEATDR